jgi:hypothetical protein
MNSNRGIYHSHSHTLQFVGHDQEDITNSPKGCNHPSCRSKTTLYQTPLGFNVFTIPSRIPSLKLEFKEIHGMVMEVDKGISRIEV